MIPKWRGHVEFRFAQLKKSPTTESMIFRIGPFLSGESMFRSTHFTKSWDFSPMMFACSAGWIIVPLPCSKADSCRGVADERGLLESSHPPPARPPVDSHPAADLRVWTFFSKPADDRRFPVFTPRGVNVFYRLDGSPSSERGMAVNPD